MNTDCQFPIITYPFNLSDNDRGIKLGETFRKEIKELFLIRKNLMLTRNPRLKDSINTLANQQLIQSQKFDLNLSTEMQGIAKGSNLKIEDIIILNNYTDFRDIELPEEGCSTVAISQDQFCAGQTWDMHASAKNYLNLIEIEGKDGEIKSIVFSLVGCLGMMGINKDGCFIGVNNINTRNAKASVVWPILVRNLLKQQNTSEMRNVLQQNPVTSGHNYLIADKHNAYQIEVTPTLYQEVSEIKDTQKGGIFHTNHCLGNLVKPQEITNMLSSTTHPRYQILENKVKTLKDKNDLLNLLKSHENYPKSICSHFQTSAQDPSTTCGGGVVNLHTLECIFWRGCKKYDTNYKEHTYNLKNERFNK